MKVGVFNTAFVGDVALMGQLVDALARAGHEVYLISNPAGCALYQFDPRVYQTVRVSKDKGIGKAAAVFKIARLIHNLRLDVLLVAHGSFTTGLCASLSGVKKIFSFSGSAISHFSFEKVSCSGSVHESRRYLELCRHIVDHESFESAQLLLNGDSSFQNLSRVFPQLLSHEAHEFFICSPGSVWFTKRYPPKLLARLVERLLTARPNLHCVVSGGPQDRSVIEQLLQCVQKSCPHFLTSNRILDAQKCLPLGELIELTKRASFVLTPDSAPLHIASAAGTRTFALFGPTSANTGFGPLAPHSHVVDFSLVMGSKLDCQPCSKHGHQVCPKRHHRCLADLPPDAIAEVLLDSLSVQ